MRGPGGLGGGKAARYGAALLEELGLGGEGPAEEAAFVPAARRAARRGALRGGAVPAAAVRQRAARGAAARL